MATEVRYSPEHIGDWGVQTAAPGGSAGTDTFTLADGTSIFFRFWRAADPSAPVLVLLHGLGAHTGWFIDMGNSLNALGLTVYMDDHRGFGRSGGARGHVRDGSIYLRDIDAFRAEVRARQADVPLVLLGHSMGAIFATYLAAADATKGKNQLAGLILMNPWVGDTVKLAPATVITTVIGGMLGSARYVSTGSETRGMTLSPEATTLLNADSYWVRQRSAAFLYQISRMRLGMLKQAALVRAPALVVQCEKDTTVSHPATRRCFELLGSSDKTWQTYPDFAHDCEFESGRGVLDAGLAQWTLQRRR